MKQIGGVHLLTSFLRHRRGQAGVLLLLGMLLSGAVLSIAMVRDSAQAAIVQALRADLGGRAYVLQTGQPAAAQALARTSASPVADDQGTVVAGDLAAPVLIRTTTDPALRLGVLVEGRRPHEPGEVMLSLTTARALNVRLGDEVSVNRSGQVQPGRVVGFSVDPADATNSTLVQLVSKSPEFTATRWLSQQDFYTDALLRDVLESRSAVYQSTASVEQNALDNRPRFLSAMRFLPVGIGLLLAVVILAAVTALTRSWKGYVEAMVAAGMSWSAAWRRCYGIVFTTLLIGEISGGVAVAAILAVTKVQVSGWFGQHWTQLALPIPEFLTIIVATGLAALLAPWVLRTARRLAARAAGLRTASRLSRRTAAMICSAAIVAWLVVLYSDAFDSNKVALYAPPLAVLILAAVPFALAPLSGVALPRAMRGVTSHLASGLRAATAVACVLALSGAIWAARTTQDANAGEALSSPLEPPGSFVISAVPNAVLPDLEAIYRAQGGEQLVAYPLPAEPDLNVRVSSPRLADCLTQRSATSPLAALTPCAVADDGVVLNVVAIAPPGSPARADPRLVEDGRVALFAFRPSSPTPTRLPDVPATPDPLLGGNIPGLVLASDSPALAGLGVADSGTSAVLFVDFDRLTPRQQVFLRAAVFRLAASAQTADGTDPTAYDRLRSNANVVGTVSAAAAAVVLLLGGLSAAVTHVTTRRRLVELGGAVGPRHQIIARLCGVPLLTAALTVPLAYLSVSHGGQASGVSYGLIWLLPGAASVAAAVAVGAAFLRVPEPAGE